MITKSELRLNLVALRILSYMSCIPFKISPTTGRMEDGSLWKRISYKFLLVISLSHFLFSILRLPSTLDLGWSAWEVVRKVLHAYVLLFEAGIPMHIWTGVRASAYNKIIFNDLLHNLPSGWKIV